MLHAERLAAGLQALLCEDCGSDLVVVPPPPKVYESLIRGDPSSLGLLYTSEGGAPPPPSESVQKSTEAL